MDSLRLHGTIQKTVLLQDYSEILKIWTPEKIAVIILKFEQYRFTTD